MANYERYCRKINLYVEGRISQADAARQDQTARDILKRLYQQPGLILADEVGMGKTFVALAVGTSVALANKSRNPVVVMVPPSLKNKWRADFELFREKCLPDSIRPRVQAGTADRAEDFLKLLDDPKSQRKSIIFITHGAMSRGLSDGWVKLSLIYQAVKHKKHTKRLKRALCRSLGRLLHMSWIDKQAGEEFWSELLSTHPREWLSVCQEWDIDPTNNDNPKGADDPVPEAIWKALPSLKKHKARQIYESMDRYLPRKQSKNYEAYLEYARDDLRAELKDTWKNAIRSIKLRLPLLILDEAHHLKNAKTKLAHLFHSDDAQQDADELSRGPLEGVFKRMLFLTATPFQLGHHELCSVLDRFQGISWKGRRAPRMGTDGFSKLLQFLRSSLDRAQEAAITLDTAWGKLSHEDLMASNKTYSSVEEWWPVACNAKDLTPPRERGSFLLRTN